MDGELLAEVLNGPYGFLVAIVIFGYLASKEIHKARAERVAEAEEAARTERERRIELEAELRATNEATNRRIWKAREMLIAKGVPPEELP